MVLGTKDTDGYCVEGYNLATKESYVLTALYKGVCFLNRNLIEIHLFVHRLKKVSPTQY